MYADVVLRGCSMKVVNIDSHLAYIQKDSSVLVTDEGSIPRGLSTKVALKGINTLAELTSEQGLSYSITKAGYIKNLVYVRVINSPNKTFEVANALLDLMEKDQQSTGVIISRMATGLTESNIRVIEQLLHIRASRKDFTIFMYE